MQRKERKYAKIDRQTCANPEIPHGLIFDHHTEYYDVVSLCRTP